MRKQEHFQLQQYPFYLQQCFFFLKISELGALNVILYALFPYREKFFNAFSIDVFVCCNFNVLQPFNRMLLTVVPDF